MRDAISNVRSASTALAQTSRASSVVETAILVAALIACSSEPLPQPEPPNLPSAVRVQPAAPTANPPRAVHPIPCNVAGRSRRTLVSLGSALRVIPDVDGDGKCDLLFAAPLAGEVGIISTRTFLLHWSRTMPIMTGFSIDAGATEWNGRQELLIAVTADDGVRLILPGPDIELPQLTAEGRYGVVRVASTPSSDVVVAKSTPFASTAGYVGRVVIQSVGASVQPTVLTGRDRREQLGRDVCFLSDRSDSGRIWLAVGSPGVGEGPLLRSGVCVVDPLTGNSKFTVHGAGAEDHAGWAVAPYPDQDGDFCEELLVSIPCGLPTEEFLPALPDFRGSCLDGGGLWLLSGRTGAKLNSVRFSSSRRNDGFAIAPVGDIDGDGMSEVAVTSLSAVFTPGYVSLYSLKLASPLWTSVGEEVAISEFGSFGRAVCGGVDVDADRVPDVIVGGGHIYWESGGGDAGGPGHIYFYSGKDGRLIRVIDEL